MKKRTLNTELLKQIAAIIQERPRNFYMHDWACGTAGCIAGWACCIKEFKANPEAFRSDEFDWNEEGTDVQTRAMKHLGLSSACAEKLFFTDNWPAPFEEDYENGKTKADQAKVAAKRIEHFLKTGE